MVNTSKGIGPRNPLTVHTLLRLILLVGALAFFKVANGNFIVMLAVVALFLFLDATEALVRSRRPFGRVVSEAFNEQWIKHSLQSGDKQDVVAEESIKVLSRLKESLNREIQASTIDKDQVDIVLMQVYRHLSS